MRQEFRNTPQKPPIRERPDLELVEDLCLALRELGGLDGCLPDWEPALGAIAEVKMLAREARRRGLSLSARISRLSRETGWPIGKLLDDAVRYPDAIPYLPRTPPPQCGVCRERISRRAVLGLCDSCLAKGIDDPAFEIPDNHLKECSICGREERGFLVYAQAYQWINYCRQCLESERARRAKRADTP